MSAVVAEDLEAPGASGSADVGAHPGSETGPGAGPEVGVYDAVVIGSGMSGLSAAIILAKEGKKVLVLEQHYRAGGFLHRFFRKGGLSFDVGFHYVGGLEPRQVLGRYLRYLGVADDLEPIALDPEGYDHIQFPGLRFAIPAGRPRYRQRLVGLFPNSAAAIDRYLADLDTACDAFAFYRLDKPGDAAAADRVLSLPLGRYLDDLGVEPLLRAALLAQNPLYGVPPSRTPFGVHALVVDSFMQGPYTLRGGGDALAQAMVARLAALGGKVRTRCGAARIEVDEVRGAVTAVHTEHGERIPTPLVVSCAHPKAVVRMLPESALRPGYRRRVLALEEGAGTLSAFITTDADLSAHRGHNVYHYESLDLDALYDGSGNNRVAFVTVPTSREGRGKSGLEQVIVLGLMRYAEVAAFGQSQTGERGAAYEAFKAAKADELVTLACVAVPELRGKIHSVECATPLTNRDYAGSEEGAAYGVLRSVEQSGRYGLRPRTRVDGLWLTGQSVLMPGVLGVTVSAFHTCAQILGEDNLRKKVADATA